MSSGNFERISGFLTFLVLFLLFVDVLFFSCENLAHFKRRRYVNPFDFDWFRYKTFIHSLIFV